MSRSIIYTFEPSTGLTAMRPSEPRSEDFMQELVAAYPELITDQDGGLLLIRREQPIADREDGGGRWSLDHLFVTRSGIPVLVELKRAVDTRLRREVVGQMLDYAANGTAHWKAGRIAESFAATMTSQGRNADVELASFLGAAANPEEFWEQVDANFDAGRIKMVFVADTIPRELARIVEFLNEQMKADVRAIELSWFESESGVTALTPRVIGETQRAQTEKAARSALPAISRETWIERHLAQFGLETAEAAATFIRLVDEAGGRTDVTKAQASIYADFVLPGGTLYPFSLGYSRKGQVSLNLSYLMGWPAFAPDEARQDLYDRLVAATGPLSSDRLNGYPAFPVVALNDPVIEGRFRDFLQYVRASASAAG